MLTSDHRLFIAAAENPVTLKADGRELCLEGRMASRHGLITGATGTGKTISLQTMAESFSAMGVPVLLTDIKGDLSAMSRPGEPGGSVAARIKELGLREEDYSWYLDLRKYGGTKHAGFGLGFERLVMYLTGIANIRSNFVSCSSLHRAARTSFFSA